MTITEERPSVNVENVLTIDAKRLQRAIRAVAVAASADEYRPILAGIQIDVLCGAVTMTATDSYQLHIATLSADGINDEETFSALVSARWLVDVVRGRFERGDTVSLKFHDDRCSIWLGNEARSVALLKGPFPHYRQLVPTGDALKGEAKVAVNPTKLIKMLRAADMFREGDSEPLHILSMDPGKPNLFRQDGSNGDTLDLILMTLRTA